MALINEMNKTLDGAKDALAEGTSGATQPRVTPSSRKFDKDGDLRLDKSEYRAKVLDDLSVMEEVQNDLVFYFVQKLNERQEAGEINHEEKLKLGRHLIRKIVTTENSSTLQPAPTIIDKAKAKAIENIFLIVMMLIMMFYPLIQALTSSLLGV